jgi:uncharacterized protein (DUF779 family)
MNKRHTEALNTETYDYGECQITCTIHRVAGTGNWTANGKVNIYHKNQLLHFDVPGVKNTFTTEDAARQDFLARAKQILDDRRRP